MKGCIRLVVWAELRVSILIEFYSGKECAIQLDLNHGNITSVLKDRRKQTGGYKFEYAK